jgi:hypothetical protein
LIDVFGARWIYWKTGGPRLPETIGAMFAAIQKVSHHRPLASTDKRVLRVLSASLDRWSNGEDAEFAGLLGEAVERRLGERLNETDEASLERSRRMLELYQEIRD